jgi:hypothetical protein
MHLAGEHSASQAPVDGLHGAQFGQESPIPGVPGLGWTHWWPITGSNVARIATRVRYGSQNPRGGGAGGGPKRHAVQHRYQRRFER